LRAGDEMLTRLGEGSVGSRVTEIHPQHEGNEPIA
jgi:hypothetical protein